MDGQTSDSQFLDALPVFARFEGVADLGNYQPLPADWVLATADIVGSTKAIAEGRYKSVNTAGASVISALLNEIGRRDLPFVFGGDGALIALPGSDSVAATSALAAVQTWVAEELDLSLRAALVPMREIRAAGLDVRVAKFRASDHVAYAMFAGGGASWAESEMKAGRFGIAPAPAGARPDLTGLSCRWDPIEARSGEIVSIIAIPAKGAKTDKFQRLVGEIVALAGEQARAGHPVPEQGPGYHLIPKGLDIEARAMAAGTLGRLRAKAAIVAQLVLTAVLDKTGWNLGRFSAERYKRDVADNSDFRKFDDGLKMTLDVDRSVLERIEDRLRKAEKDGVCQYGLHRQSSALMTCIVATPLERDHIHFVDGAAGGYAMAAANMKAKAGA